MLYYTLPLLILVMLVPLRSQPNVPRVQPSPTRMENGLDIILTVYKFILWLVVVSAITSTCAIYIRSLIVVLSIQRENQINPGWSHGMSDLLQMLLAWGYVGLLSLIACACMGVALWLRPRLGGEKRRWIWAAYLGTAVIVLTATWAGLEHAYRWGPHGIFTRAFWSTYGFGLNTTSQGDRELRFSTWTRRGDARRRTEALKLLGQIPNLRWLSLTDYQLHDDDMIWVARVPSLEMLSVNKNPITSDGLRHIAALPNLKACYYVDTNVDDEIIPVLLSMGKLTHISYVGSKMTEQRAQEVNSTIENRNPDARKHYLRDYDKAQEEFRGS